MSETDRRTALSVFLFAEIRNPFGKQFALSADSNNKKIVSPDSDQ